MWDAISNIASVIAVIGVFVILVGNIWLYKKTRLNPFLWYVVGWVLALFVRVYIMMTDLWPSTFAFKEQVAMLQGLFAITYVALAIGSIIKVKAIYSLFKGALMKEK